MILVTGSAGFVGFHASLRLLGEGHAVHGLDNMNDYYDVSLKEARTRILQAEKGFTFHKADLADAGAANALFDGIKPSVVVHMAAQAGVRHSLANPRAYADSNVIGFLNVLEGCRAHGVKHLVYASSSSVYGLNTALPFSVHQATDHPVSFYAATKKANELMAHSYSSLYGLPTTGLRFFTVYGPWGRPDMALFLFTQRILAGEPIDVFNEGHHQRDFTYIDDIVAGVVAAVDHLAAPDPSFDAGAPDPSTSYAPYRIYNIGNQRPVKLLRYIEVLERCLGRTALKNLLPMQPGDLQDTWADVSALARDVGYRPSTELEVGVRRFVDWYLEYYR